MRIGAWSNPAGRVRPGGGRPRRCPLCLVILLSLVALPSCAFRSAPVQPPVAVPQAFSSQGEAAMPDRWWTAFGDADLDSLVDQALQDNFSLRVAWDRLNQATALAAKSGASLVPSLEGSAGASRTVTRSPMTGRNYTTGYSLGLLAGYEVDLWGRVRAARDAALLDALATSEDLHAAAMTLSAEVAGTWYTLVEHRGHLRLLDEQMKTNEKYLEIITLKFRRGQVSATDVLQQRQLVESVRGERILVESRASVLEHQLAVLLGRAPGSVSITVRDEFAELPPLPRAGVPAEWVRRRPDVRAAELRVRAADRRVAAAVADRFPKLSLSLRADTSAERIHDLFDNWLASLAANVAAPLFDGGLRRAEVERTQAVVSERLNSYGQTVLTSLKEVEDALAQEAKQAEYLDSLREQLDLSEQSTQQTRENYTKGATDFTRYLTTLLSHQRLQRTHLQAQRESVQFRIDLYRALGGGWELEAPAKAGMAELEAPTVEWVDVN